MSAGPSATGSSFVPAEYDCCECGRHIVLITSPVPPTPPLCAACQSIPGWYRFPQLRAVLDPEHDGLEVWEREASGQ